MIVYFWNWHWSILFETAYLVSVCEIVLLTAIIAQLCFFCHVVFVWTLHSWLVTGKMRCWYWLRVRIKRRGSPMLSAPKGKYVFSHVGSHQSWVGWAVTSVGADNQSSTSNLLWFLYQPGRRRRWIKYDNYEKFILSFIGDYINLLCIAPDRGGGGWPY